MGALFWKTDKCVLTLVTLLIVETLVVEAIVEVWTTVLAAETLGTLLTLVIILLVEILISDLITETLILPMRHVWIWPNLRVLIWLQGTGVEVHVGNNGVLLFPCYP